MSYIMMARCWQCGAEYSAGTIHVCDPTRFGYQWWQGGSPLYTPVVEACNEHIACEPFKDDVTEPAKKGTGFHTMKGATTLTALTVVFGNKEYLPGQIIYVSADLARNPAVAKAVFEVEGKSVVFIPVKEIKLVKRVAATPPTYVGPAYNPGSTTETP